MVRWFRLAVGLALAASLCLAAAAHAAQADVRRVWQLLDYLAVDYGAAVQGGTVVSASEFDEMREFAATARARLATLDPHPEREALMREAGELAAAIEARQPAERVAARARSLAGHLLAVYPVPTAPARAPEPAAAAALYQSACASCHGAAGHGDGPLGRTLDPRPVAFTDRVRARERSVFALYQAISQGIEGTAMPAFATLPDADRWALAFHVGGFASTPQEVEAGRAAWTGEAALRARVGGLDALSRLTEAELAREVGETPAALAMAYLRAHPDAVAQQRPAGFGPARRALADSLQAAGQGDAPRAADLALSAYLDGVEPLEPVLAARDRALMARIETAMGAYRSMLASRAPASELRAQVARIDALFGEADALLGTRAGAGAAFLGSLTILVREGLEALLVVVAMIAFLRRAERADMLRYVHAGWIGALAMGAVTWGVATWAVGISGASREVTEGLSSLFAALVLLSVGMWMHQKSMAGMWQQYVRDTLSAALSRRSAWFMAGLSFIAVYREVFETILFYAALWEQGNHAAVLGGLGAGVAILAAVAVAMLRFSARLPIGAFFSWSSALVAVLAVVLTGKGVAALQEAGWLAASTFDMASIDLLGVHPSVQGIGAQLLMVLLVVAGFVWNARVARGRTRSG